MSHDVFQLQMDAILEQYPGVIGIHDDVVIFGVSNKHHDANIVNSWMCVKRKALYWTAWNKLRRQHVSFFGAEYSEKGMHSEPKKTQGIVEMTALQDKQQLQSFLGMVNYIGTFIPHLSHYT